MDEVLTVIQNVANEGNTILLVTHELDFAREIADRIVFMEDGIIVEEGTAEQIFTNPTVERTKQFISKALKRH